MKKLPSIYKQSINKKFNNNNTVYYSTTRNIEKKEDKFDPKEFIGSLFKEGGHIFNKALIIKTKDKIYDTSIIRSSEDYIYTLTEDSIRISDIISIERK